MGWFRLSLRWLANSTVRALRAGALVAFAVALSVAGCATETDDGEPAPEAVHQEPIVIVLNGCGVPGAARSVAEALADAGYDVGNGHGENADSFKYPKTLVVDLVGRPGRAEPLAERLGAPLIQQISYDPDRFGTVSVIVGADYYARVQQFTGG